MDEVNFNMDDVDDDGMFVFMGGRQLQVLLLFLFDFMCVQFVLCMVCVMGLCFNLCININDIFIVCVLELIWFVMVIQWLQCFLFVCCVDMLGWCVVGKFDLFIFMECYGQWSSVFDEGLLFYYFDEYVKYYVKDMFIVFGVLCDVLGE